MKRILLAAAAVSCLFLSACDINQDSLLSDDAYTQHVTNQGHWEVQYNGDVSVEQEPDGSIDVFGYASGNNSHPDIKVSGEGIVFKVFAARHVKADDGTTVQVYYSDLVKAGHKTNINAFNCTQVVGAFDAAVVPHGHTSVNLISAPKAPNPVDANGGVRK
jgi:hypothetical protein